MNHYFGNYAGAYTTAADADAVLALMHGKENLTDESKRDAVYIRNEPLVRANVAAGMFFKIERLARDADEFKALGAERRLIAITGSYILGIGEDGKQRSFPIDTAKNRGWISHKVAEVGSTLSLQEKDLPNEEGLYPNRCFYRLLVGATQMNLFRLAGAEVNGRTISFDTITANVQDRTKMRPITNWLTEHDLLGWKMIERPSAELQEATSDTTAAVADEKEADPNFKKDKLYYEATPHAFPTIARYLLNIAGNQQIVSDHDYEPNVARISLDLSCEMTAFLRAVANDENGHFTQKRGVGLQELRRTLYIPQAANGNGTRTRNGSLNGSTTTLLGPQRANVRDTRDFSAFGAAVPVHG